MMPRKADIVKISYNDLVTACSNDHQSSIDDLIERAFGNANSSSLGIIAITDIPSLPSLRSKLLPLAPKLAALPPHQLEEITAPQSQYQVGWSHGREKLEGDKPDFSKGSYYANPLTDDLVESMLERRRYNSTSPQDGDKISVHDKQQMEEVLKWDESLNQIKSEEELRQLANANPAFFAPNVWPTKSLPELENALKEMGQLIHQVGVHLAKCCDLYVAARVSVFCVADYVELVSCSFSRECVWKAARSQFHSIFLDTSVPRIQSKYSGEHSTAFQVLQGPATPLLCHRWYE